MINTCKKISDEKIQKKPIKVVRVYKMSRIKCTVRVKITVPSPKPFSIEPNICRTLRTQTTRDTIE